MFSVILTCFYIKDVSWFLEFNNQKDKKKKITNRFVRNFKQSTYKSDMCLLNI